MYNNLLSFGDIIELNIDCNVKKLLDNISKFEWLKYNPRKDINRYGLSVTSLDGNLTGIDLSTNMLRIAKKKLKNKKNKKKVIIKKANLINFKFNQKFNAAYSLFDVICLMTKEKDLKKFF